MRASSGITSSTITSWISSQPGTPADNPYLIYYDNPPATTLTVSGTATAMSSSDTVDIDCFYGAPSTIVKLAAGVPVRSGAFTTPPLTTFRAIAGHACRLRALPANGAAEGPAFTGPQVAVAEAKTLGILGGPNTGKPFNFYLNGVTLTGFAAWTAAGTPSPNSLNANACGGANMAAIDSSFTVGNPALDCVGALLSDDLGAGGGRSEVQIDGRNAYDAPSAQGLFSAGGSSNPTPPSQNNANFPSMSTSANWDPATGLISSSANEAWVACNGPDVETPTFTTCPSFTPLAVQLQRDLSTSDGGRVVTMTDTWSSTDHAAHTLDLRYDDNIGVVTNSVSRGYQFPGESGFSAHVAGDQVPGPSAAPGSIFVRTNAGAADGDASEGIGSITFSRAPSGFGFVSGKEFEEHHVLQVPADGTATLSYIYSTDYSLAPVTALALVAQDRLQPLAVAVTSPASGTTVSSPVVTVTGTATSGSGIRSLVVGGQNVPVGSGGAWSASVPLNQGSNTIDVLATDGAGNIAQGQLTVVYQPPPPPVRCKVPRTKGMKLKVAERALRRAHCRAGRIKRVRSHKVRRGRVMSTNPRAGRQLRPGTRVELYVSNGPVRTAAQRASLAARALG